MINNVKKYYLKNENIRFSLLNLGSTIVQLDVKLADGTWQPTVLAYEHLNDYIVDEVYLNSIVGPYAGRIKGANFLIDGKRHYLTSNEGENSLHSGNDGLQNKYFRVKKNGNKLIAEYSDFNKKTEFPAGSVYRITYILMEDGLKIEMKAFALGSTLLNITQHTYFNLEQPYSTIDRHKLMVASNQIYSLDKDAVPYVKQSIKNSVFDFNVAKSIQDVLNQTNDQFHITGNIDHPYIIEEWPITVETDKINLKVFSDAPECVIYFSNSIDNNIRKLKRMGIAKKHAAIAIEPQTYPNAINLEKDSDQIYRNGRIFKRKIIYKFIIK